MLLPFLLLMVNCAAVTETTMVAASAMNKSYRKTAVSVRQHFNWEPHPPIALGPNTLLELARQGDLFVDKTLLIKAVVQHPAQLLSICRPRRWGKSVNIEMIASFLQITVDEHGRAVTPNSSSSASHRFYARGIFTTQYDTPENLREPLLITHQHRFIDQYLARHPVVFVNLTKIKARNFVDMIHAIATRVADSYKSHSYIMSALNLKTRAHLGVCGELESDNTQQAQHHLVTFERVLANNKNNTKFGSIVDIQNNCKSLTAMLHWYFNKSVFLLIDDYDAPIVEILASSANDAEKKQFLDFYTSFLTTTFIQNEHLAKGILTGVFPLWKEARAGPLGAIVEDTLDNSTLTEFYGIDQHDMNVTFNETNMPAYDRKEGFLFFNKYRTINTPDVVIYPIWSIVNYVCTKELQPYSLDKNTKSKVTNFLKNFLPFRPFDKKFFWAFFRGYKAGDVELPNRLLPLTWKDFALMLRASVVGYSIPQFHNITSGYESHELADKAIGFMFMQGYYSLELDAKPNSSYWYFKIPSREGNILFQQAYPLPKKSFKEGYY